MISFETWLDLNEEEANCYAAETGADRELDYDSETFLERLYDEYVDTGKTWYTTEEQRRNAFKL